MDDACIENMSFLHSNCSLVRLRQVALNASLLVPGARYTFSLVVTNFLGARSSVAMLAVAKSLSPAPLVAVQGAAVRTTTRALGVALVAASELPNVACGAGATGADALDSLAMGYRWELLSSERDDSAADDGDDDDAAAAAASLALAAAEESTTRLMVAGGMLAARTTYTFEVVAYMAQDPSLNASAVVSVHVRQVSERVVAWWCERIAGGGSSRVMR